MKPYPPVAPRPAPASAANTSPRAARRRRWPARLDVAQSVSGLLLALFMLGHMVFVSSILLGADAMWVVTKAFEGYFVFGRPVPVLVSAVVAGVTLLVVLHALLAMRKLPSGWRQWHVLGEHRRALPHGGTTLWWLQALTGVALLFLVTPHLYQMLVHPGDIGPYASPERVWSGRWWPLYLVLLLAVEVHLWLGLYRLAVKWHWLPAADPEAGRRRARRIAESMVVASILLGLTTLVVEMKTGWQRRDHPGERYTPAWAAPAAR